MIEVPGGHRADPTSPPFPGGIGVSYLRVYDSVGIDGLAGGTPHCHTACTEAYAVVSGRGRVLTLGGDGYRETELVAGSFAWFTPGTIHRLVNDSGDLEIVVIMANAGLPEAGDMVITFPDEVLADAGRYARAATLPPEAGTTAAGDTAVRVRKDLAISGFAALVDGGPDALGTFHRRAAALVQPSIAHWRSLWQAGPVAAIEATASHLDLLARGATDHLAHSAVHALPPPPVIRRYGCCGELGVVIPGASAT